MPVAKLLALGAVFALTLQAQPVMAQKMDAWKQFSLKQNPNGQWSYLAAGELQTKTLKKCGNVKRLLCWWNGGQVPNSAVVGANKSGSTVSFYTIVLPAKYLLLDPENLSDVAVQWTASSTGTVRVTGNFLGVDTNEQSHDVAVLHDGVAVKSFTIGQYQQQVPFAVTVDVAPGDTISFASYTNGYAYLSTGLQAEITIK